MRGVTELTNRVSMRWTDRERVACWNPPGDEDVLCGNAAGESIKRSVSTLHRRSFKDALGELYGRIMQQPNGGRSGGIMS